MPNEYGKLIRDGVNYSHDTAESISYDNTTSGLTADTAQDAIDELASTHNGGHDIIDDDGTEMNKRSGLQFIGSYNTDDSTNDKSVVNVVRTMTEAQRSQLSQAEQKGFIYTTDSDNTPLTASEVTYNLGEGNTTDVQTVLDNMTNTFILDLDANPLVNGDTFNITQEVADIIDSHMYFVNMVLNTNGSSNTSASRVNVIGQMGAQMGFCYDRSSGASSIKTAMIRLGRDSTTPLTVNINIWSSTTLYLYKVELIRLK